MTLRIKLSGVEPLAAELSRLDGIRFDAVVKKNMTQIYNRGKQDSHEQGIGTPVDTGQLRQSLGQSGDEVGYSKTYAPHVEYGHRTVNGGYVQGQRYLYDNVEEQRPVFKKDLKDQLNKR